MFLDRSDFAVSGCEETMGDGAMISLKTHDELRILLGLLRQCLWFVDRPRLSCWTMWRGILALAS